MVCEIYSEKNQDGDLEYKMRLLNCINLIDISNKKKKKPMQTPAQIEYLKQVILDYNQGGDENYSNILGVYIDAGSGGGGVNIADYLMPDLYLVGSIKWSLLTAFGNFLTYSSEYSLSISPLWVLPDLSFQSGIK